MWLNFKFESSASMNKKRLRYDYYTLNSQPPVQCDLKRKNPLVCTMPRYYQESNHRYTSYVAEFQHAAPLRSLPAVWELVDYAGPLCASMLCESSFLSKSSKPER
jgi:hypothetical protein